MAVFWDAALCSLKVQQHFRGAYCLHHQGNFYQTTWCNVPEENNFTLADVRNSNLDL
jgi:hypothetical protein